MKMKQNTNGKNQINYNIKISQLRQRDKDIQFKTNIILNKSCLKMRRQHQFQIEYLEVQWSCPITNMPMKQPVVTMDGQSYEKRFIQKWFQTNNTSPATGAQLASKQLIPNIALKNVISKYENEIKYEWQKLNNQNTNIKSQNILLKSQLMEYKGNCQKLQQMVNKNKINEITKQSDKELLTKFYHKYQVEKIEQYKQQIEQLKVNKLKACRLKSQKTNFNTLFNKISSIFTNIFSISVNQSNKQFKQPKISEVINVNRITQDRQDNQVRDDNFMNLGRQIAQEPFNQVIEYQDNNLNEYQKWQVPNQEFFFLPYQDYLQDFPVIYNESNLQLNHQGIKIDMNQFIKYKWPQLKIINLVNTEINDQALQIFFNFAQQFKNLQTISLWTNMITNVRRDTLEKFPKLKEVAFSNNSVFNYNLSLINPLNQQSKKYLVDISSKNPNIQIKF